MANLSFGLSVTPRRVLAIICFVCCLHFTFIKASSLGKTASDDKQPTALPTEVAHPTLIESIPQEYRRRYQRWKAEYLSTAVGYDQWKLFALNSEFTLTITVSKKEGQGARIDGYRWDEYGKFVAATIVLGNKLDSGYPSSINYPITCSLGTGNLPSEVKGKILAATKLAHEFGHLNQILSMNGNVYQLQNKLMLEYNKIFDSNGFIANDPRLVDLIRAMGGTPVDIQQEREHWAEMGAILFLCQRLPELGRRAKIPGPIKEAIDSYYSIYPDRIQLWN